MLVTPSLQAKMTEAELDAIRHPRFRPPADMPTEETGPIGECVVFHLPVHTAGGGWAGGRSYVHIANIEQFTGAALKRLLQRLPTFRLIVWQAFALVDIKEAPLEFRTGDEVSDYVDVGVDGMVEHIKAVVAVLSLKPVGHRTTIEHDDAGKTLGELGYDRRRHAIQCYPEKLLSLRQMKNTRLWEEHPGLETPTPGAASMTAVPPPTSEALLPTKEGPLIEEIEAETPTAPNSQLVTVGESGSAHEADDADTGTPEDTTALLEMYRAEATSLVTSLAQARDAEDFVVVHRSLPHARRMLGGTFLDGSNHVQGKARAALTNAIKKAEPVLTRYLAAGVEQRALWNGELRERKRQAIIDAFGREEEATLCRLLADESRSAGMTSQFGEAVSFERVLKTMRAVRQGKFCISEKHPALRAHRGRVNPNIVCAGKAPEGKKKCDLVFLHVAELLVVERDTSGGRDASGKQRHGIPGLRQATQAFACALFAHLFPLDEDRAVFSGLPLDRRRDDEQHTLYFFPDPSGIWSCALLGDDFEQHHTWHAKGDLPGVAPGRELLLTADKYEKSQVHIETRAYFAYRTILCAGEMQGQRLSVATQLVQLDDYTAAEKVLSSYKLPTDAAMLEWFVRLAREGKRVLVGSMHYGLRHAGRSFATHHEVAVIDHQQQIKIIEDLAIPSNNNYPMGHLPFMQPPPLDAQDQVLEEAYWESVSKGSLDVGEAHVLCALLTLCDEPDALLQCAEAISGSECGDSSQAKAARELACDLLPWLRDPAIVREQQKRAEQVRVEWESMGRASRAAKPSRERRERAQAISAPQPIDVTPSASGTAEAAMEALEQLASKRMGYREVLKGVNILQRQGLLRAEAGGMHVRVRGSHIVCHGRNGAATLVRDHKGSKARTGAVFLRDMSRLIDASAARA